MKAIELSCKKMADTVTGVLSDLGPIPGFREFAVGRRDRAVVRRQQGDGFWVTLRFECKLCRGLSHRRIAILDDWDGTAIVDHIIKTRNGVLCRMSEQCKGITSN